MINCCANKLTYRVDKGNKWGILWGNYQKLFYKFTNHHINANDD